MNFRYLTIIVFTILLSSKVFSTQNNFQSNDLSTRLIVNINALTYRIANEHDQFYSFIGVRALAMVHLAIHDILVSQGAPYRAYSYDDSSAEVNTVTAVIACTQTILVEAYPDRSDTIIEVCSRWLNMINADLGKIEGVALGRKVAQHYIDLRRGDGHQRNGDYTPMTKPGDYQYTPGFDWVWIPDFSLVRPFTLDSLTQFRSPAPPELSTVAYRESYIEVKEYGCTNSIVRTDDQTNYAHWWAEFAEHSWNRIGRLTASKNNLNAAEANRMFALLNMNLYDLYLVSFDSKYLYDTWRPYTAIRHGDDDGNPDTKGDLLWEPEMITPPWPEYPSAHAAVGAAGAEILTHVFGTSKVSFEMESVTALDSTKTRRYDDLDQAASDCADSRVMNGFHFRFATEEGKRQGRQVARHTIEHYLGKKDR